MSNLEFIAMNLLKTIIHARKVSQAPQNNNNSPRTNQTIEMVERQGVWVKRE